MDFENGVISVFHEVSADIPGRPNRTGAIVMLNRNGELEFLWREYKTKENRNEKLSEISLKISDIFKIMINHQEKEGYLLITSRASNMYQFTFPQSSSFQLIHFIQLLTLYQHRKLEKQASLDDLVAFSFDSYSSNVRNFCLFDINVNDSNIQVIPDFCITGFENLVVPIVQPDMHIVSQFGVHSKEFTENPVRIEEIDTFPNLESLKIAACNRGADPLARHLIWPLLLKILPFDPEGRNIVLKTRTEEYISLRNQWKTLSKTQLKYSTMIKDAFATIRVDVKRTHPHKQTEQYDNWNQILISILRTFAIWNLDVRYTQGLNDLALNFVSIFLPFSGSLYPPDENEALTFWCFAAFVEFVSSGLIAKNLMDMQDREMREIMSIITHFHPACSDWLIANKLEDLSFMISSFILAFGRSFEFLVVARIWESLVSVDEPWLFLRYFSASLIILSFPSFLKIPNCSSGKLVSQMDQIFYVQDVGAVIGVSLSMMKRSQQEMEAAIKNKNSNIEIPKRIGTFRPVGKFQEQYLRYGNLFS